MFVFLWGDDYLDTFSDYWEGIDRAIAITAAIEEEEANLLCRQGNKIIITCPQNGTHYFFWVKEIKV